jgi:hypothetical protein
MAVERAPEQSPDDYQAHFRDYSGFTRLLSITAVIALAIAFFVMMIIS